MHKWKKVKELYEDIKSSKSDYEDIAKIVKDDLSQKEDAERLEEVDNVCYKMKKKIADIDEIICRVAVVILPLSIVFFTLIMTYCSYMKFLIVLLILVIVVYIGVIYHYSGKKTICTNVVSALDKIRKELN